MTVLFKTFHNLLKELYQLYKAGIVYLHSESNKEVFYSNTSTIVLLKLKILGLFPCKCKHIKHQFVFCFFNTKLDLFYAQNRCKKIQTSDKRIINKIQIEDIFRYKRMLVSFIFALVAFCTKVPMQLTPKKESFSDQKDS